MYKGQKASKDGIEYFLCPFTAMYITQGSNSNFSHKGIMANDVRGLEPGVRYPYYAPCKVRAERVYPESGQVMWRSVGKVRFANGRIDFATFMTVHDDSLNVKVGQIVEQGQQLGNMGTKGNATGVHCHIQISQSSDMSWYKNKYGVYQFNNEYDLDDCYWVNDTDILGGVVNGNWKTFTLDTPKPKIKYRSHLQSSGWQEWKHDGEMSGTEGEARRLEAIQIDYDKPIYAKAHIQKDGWVDYGKITKDTIIGTTGEAKRLECLCLKCEGLKYKVHIQDSGWSCWTDADGISTLGSVGQKLRIEAIEIMEI